ncbi:hypothetical protein CsSME_00048419 [Camellia sinensis var. sinensis]
MRAFSKAISRLINFKRNTSLGKAMKDSRSEGFMNNLAAQIKRSSSSLTPEIVLILAKHSVIVCGFCIEAFCVPVEDDASTASTMRLSVLLNSPATDFFLFPFCFFDGPSFWRRHWLLNSDG